jgi:hypothetical protein
MRRTRPGTVELHCPKCKARMTAPRMDRGNWRSCPHCNATFRVPASSAIAGQADVHIYCFDCKSPGPARLSYPGNIGVEAVLWAAGILPGLFYRMWRTSDPGLACGRCGSARVQPDESPVAHG